MVVGNHSYSHPDFAEISYEEGISEIEKCDTLLDDIYEKAGAGRKYRPFRFPYGNKCGEKMSGTSTISGIRASANWMTEI